MFCARVQAVLGGGTGKGGQADVLVANKGHEPNYLAPRRKGSCSRRLLPPETRTFWSIQRIAARRGSEQVLVGRNMKPRGVTGKPDPARTRGEHALESDPSGAQCRALVA